MLTQQSGGTVEGAEGGRGSALRPVACLTSWLTLAQGHTSESYYLDLSLHHHGHGFTERPTELCFCQSGSSWTL